ncbi:GD18974 [Drosophila simulans]|uniref:GD18974 n=1 Tax=Drosophila simulans TaxID=7240 RepID=B4QZR6_DROSI|nr:GD18974 [Drosophila simulans]
MCLNSRLNPFLTSNLANTVEKPNFRLNNQNWQLWQTSSSSQGKIQMERYLPHELHDVSEETAYDSYYTEYTTPDSMDCGSDNLLVTFDYGYCDSMEARANPAAPEDDDRGDGVDPDHGDGCADEVDAIWFGTPPRDKDEKLFEVHHVQHKLLDDSMQSLISYDVDDFEEELSEPEPDEEIFYDSIECV